MVKLSNQERRFFRDVAQVYGAKISFENTGLSGQWFIGTNRILVSDVAFTKLAIYSSVFHELAHYIQWQTGKRPLYHNNQIKDLVKIFRSYPKTIRYMLQSELATDVLGKSLMKEWMPGVRYIGGYTNSEESYCFLYGWGLHAI